MWLRLFRNAGVSPALLLILCSLNLHCHAQTALPTQADLRSWGFATLGQIDLDFQLPTHLYRQDLNAKHPGGMWDCGIQFSALNAAARLDSEHYLPELEQFIAAMEPYYSRFNNLPAYSAHPNPIKADRYYDDNAWIVLDLLDTYDLTKNDRYLACSKEITRFILTGEDDQLSGGIYWHEQGKLAKHTCSNAPTIAALLRLYQLTNDKEYKTDALRLYHWLNTKLQDTDGLYFDNIKLDGTIDKTKWSYNTALMIRSNQLLYEITKEEKYLAEAERLADASIQHWFRPGDGALADDATFGHLLAECLLDLQTAHPTRADLETPVLRSLRYLHDSVRDANGFYPKRWDTPAAQPIDNPAWIHLACAARGYLFAASH